MESTEILRYQNLLLITITEELKADRFSTLREYLTETIQEHKVQNNFVLFNQSKLTDDQVKSLEAMVQFHKNQLIQYHIISPSLESAYAQTVNEALDKLGTNESKKILLIRRLEREERQLDEEVTNYEEKIATLIFGALGEKLEPPLHFRTIKEKIVILEQRKMQLAAFHEKLAREVDVMLGVRNKLKDTQDLPALNVAINAAFNIMAEKGIQKNG